MSEPVPPQPESSLSQARTTGVPPAQASADPSKATGLDKSARQRRLIIEYAIIIVAAVIIALFVQAYVVKPFRIPSGSMMGTLKKGDRVFVNRFIYHFRGVHRGDIVVFKEPKTGQQAGTVLIKRVIGLPGEVISLENGHVLINGQVLDEPYVRRVDDGTGNKTPEPTGVIAPGTAWSLAKPYKIPDGEYFMMGDNRTDSGDSREFGPVPRSRIIGTAFFIYWPLDRIRFL